MALQTSGQISTNQVQVEATGSPYSSGFQHSMGSTSFRRLVEGTGRDINKTANTQIKMSDFYGATHFKYNNAGSSSPRIETVSTSYFTQSDTNVETATYAGTQVQFYVQTGTGNGVTVSIKDTTSVGPTLASYDPVAANSFNFSANPYYDPSANAVRNAAHGLQFRWSLYNANITFEENAAGESFHLGYFNGTTFVEQKKWVGNVDGDQTNITYNSPWVDWNPIPGVAINLKAYAYANLSGSAQFFESRFTLSSNGYIAVQIRDDMSTSSSQQLHLKRNYSSSSSPLLVAESQYDQDDGGT